jgi:CRP/FNR family transcriptional regulator
VSEAEEKTVQLLRSVPLFAELDETELSRIASVAVPRSFPEGVRVFHEGDKSDACYVVKSGTFRVTREHPDGRAITLATLETGDIVGELAMLDGEVRSASVETLGGEGELLALPATDMLSLLERNPDITVKIAAALTRRLRAANERISRQSFQTVPSRVAGVLLQLASEEADENSGHEVTIRMNQADLAQLAGTSRESVSRFLADLDRAGVVRAGRGRVTIIDSAKLRNYIF